MELDRWIDGVEASTYLVLFNRVDVCFQTALDPRKADHMIRGLVKLPHGIEEIPQSYGTGKKVKLAVFASGEAAETAKKLGVEHVGLEDLIDKVKGGKIDFERCLATPQAMPKLNSIGQIPLFFSLTRRSVANFMIGFAARILGPRGLMPSPKTRTVTDDIEGGIKSVISGLMFKVDKHGYVHGSIGKIDFKPEEIKENLLAFLTAITDLRPKSLSGQFLKGCSMSSTMGHGIHIRISDLTGSPTESPSLASQKKGARRKGVDPAAWGTVDLSQPGPQTSAARCQCRQGHPCAYD
eukprot:673578-Hanusia_phi.AAC.1